MHALSGITTYCYIKRPIGILPLEHYELFMAINLKECPIKMDFSWLIWNL